jgi:hypothetical protein
VYSPQEAIEKTFVTPKCLKKRLLHNICSRPAQENVMNAHRGTRLFLVVVNQHYLGHRICVGRLANLHSTVQVHPC